MRYRRRRRLWFTFAIWRRRLAFWGGALLVGLMAVLFAIAADEVQALSARIFASRPLLPLLASPLLFALAVWLAQRYFPGSQGSGIPQAIVARHLHRSSDRGGLLSMRITVGKVVLTLLGLLAGASIGREGPTVQIGAAVMLACAGAVGLKAMRGIVLAGAAAGIAAAFNTPLAGIVFAIEEMARAYEQRTSSLVLAAVIIAGMAAIACLGNYEYFGRNAVSLGFANGWLPVLAAGLAGGLAGGVFSRIIVNGSAALSRWFRPTVLRHPATFGAVCGLLIAGIGLLCDGSTFGTGYQQARTALEGTTALPTWYGLAKLLATTLSTLSGIPGGLFAPSLSVGAGIGSSLVEAFAFGPMEAVVMLGMVAYLVGVTQAPMTGFVIVMEMTGNHSMLVPLMATAVVAYGTSRLVCPKPIYHALAQQIIRTSRARQAEASVSPEPPAGDSARPRD